MPRDRKGITRKSSGQYEDPAKFFVVAAEGTETEYQYFEQISIHITRLQLSHLVKVEPLKREDTKSDFRRVIRQLDDYRRKYMLNADDELWCLIDRDRILPKNASEAGRLCRQKKYEFCLSSPCFEIWLLLHIKDLTDFTRDELQELLENRKTTASKTVLEHTLNEATKTVLGKAYHKNNPPPELLQYLPIAIHRAFLNQLDTKHWTLTDFCTRVHVLVQRIFKAELPDYKIPLI